MDEKIIVKLEIKLGEKTIDLTVDEAKKLFESLKGLFGEKVELAPYIPTYPYIPPYKPIDPWTNPWTNPWSFPNEPIIYNHVTTTGEVEVKADGSTCTSYRIVSDAEKKKDTL